MTKSEVRNPKYICLLLTTYCLLLTAPAFYAEATFKIGEIEISGNKTFSDRRLKKLIKTKEGKEYDELQAHLDQKRLISFYKANGFKDAKIIRWERKIRSFKKKIIDYEIEIEEGERIKVDYIEIKGNTVFDTEKLKKMTGIKIGDFVLDNKLFIAKYEISTLYANKGYIYAEVDHAVLPITKYNVGVQFQIKEGKRVRFGKIILEGSKEVRRAIIMREITFKEGEIYSPNKLRESQARIYGTGLFKSVRFIPVGIENQKEIVDIKFVLKEIKPRWIAFGGGYAVSSFPLWINAIWGHENLWNNGQKVKLTLGGYFNPFDIENHHKENIELSHSEPYFLSTSFQVGIHGFYNRERGMIHDTLMYEITRRGIDGRIGRFFGKSWQSFLTYRYEIAKGKGVLPDSGGVLNSILFDVSHDTRDDVFYPSKGRVFCISFEYAGGIIGGDYDFKKIDCDISKFWTLLKFILGTRLKLGTILGEGNVPDEERYILGGVNVIRGYKDMAYEAMPEWGKIIGIFNIEARMPVTKTIELVYFIDAGGIFMDKITSEEFKIGTGLGLGLRTPVGPIRVDYGHSLTENVGMPYFRIGYTF